MAGALRSLLWIATICLVQINQATAQTCDLPTFEEIEELLGLSIDAIAEELAQIQVEVNVTLNQFALTCLAVSDMRDQYQVASALVRFVFVGGVSEFDDCQEGVACNAIFNIECDDTVNMWVVNPVLLEQSVTIITGNLTRSFDDPPRLDCGTCNDDSVLSLGEHDGSTNCFLCDEACRGIGLGYCTGLTSSDCCSFYEFDVCVSECSARRVPNQDFDCVCEANYLEPNCTQCGLRCVFGEQNSNCTRCICEAGYAGDDCSVNINECEGAECGNGKCIDMIDGFTCNCSAGYTGDFCDIDIDECEGVNCINGACVDGINSFECDCNPDFTGTFCELTIDNCIEAPCLNGGICMDGILNFTCSCSSNFNGELCEQCTLDNCAQCSLNQSGVCLSCNSEFVLMEGSCVDPCSLLNCLNGGTCDSSSGVCVCADGYEGVNCENNTDNCSPNPCENGGICNNRVDSFTCDCPPDFVGNMCETRVNDCQPNPCENGGTCTDGVNSFTCDCAPNFSGDTCQTCNISNCAECSQGVEGECITCDSSYRPGFAGGCVLDSVSSCSSSSDPSQCQVELENEQYLITANRCGLETTNPPTISDDASPEMIFNTNINYYRTLYNSWMDEATSLGIETPSTVPTNENGFINQWREEVEIWLESISRWREYYSDLGFEDLPPLPSVDVETDDLDVLYSELTAYWSRVNEQFSVEAGSLCDAA